MTAEHKGKIAVITGGGRGFGKAFGMALAGKGATVYLADIDKDAALSAAGDIVERGGNARGVLCDVADPDQVGEMMASIAGEQTGIDILINNAGLHSETYNQPMEKMGLEKVRRLFDVNVMGVVTCSLAAKPYMTERNGAIINISSSAAYASGTAYGASKLAVQGITMTTAREFAPAGIRVNGISPGLIFTDTIRAELSPESVKRVMAQQILPREGEENDIVQAMLYLVSEKAAFITGETLRVTGGFALSV